MINVDYYYIQVRLPFIVAEQVEWHELSEVLSQWFCLKTGCILTEDHLQYLAFKLLGEITCTLITAGSHVVVGQP